MSIPFFISIAFLLGHQVPPANTSFSIDSGSGATERDIQQTLLARKILSESPDLASLNLIVRYRSGILTVSGPVNDIKVMSKVVLILEGMRGVEKIQKELYVGPMGVRPLPLGANDSYLNQIQLEVRRNPLPSNGIDDSQAVGSLTSGLGGADRKKPPNSGVFPRESALSILELIRAEPRFAGIRYSLNNGIIMIDSYSEPEITMEFANRLSKVPGILGVRITQD